MQTRKAIASSLLGAPNFMEFQRRYHAITILQDHIQELSAAAQALDREILFPYLTNDIFRIIFSARFEALNAGGSTSRLSKAFSRSSCLGISCTERKSVFSRPAVRTSRVISVSVENCHGSCRADAAQSLNLEVVEPSIRERLKPEIDLRRRYDFLEWTAYNILLLEELRGAND